MTADDKIHSVETEYSGSWSMGRIKRLSVQATLTESAPLRECQDSSRVLTSFLFPPENGKFLTLKTSEIPEDKRREG